MRGRFDSMLSLVDLMRKLPGNVAKMSQTVEEDAKAAQHIADTISSCSSMHNGLTACEPEGKGQFAEQ